MCAKGVRRITSIYEQEPARDGIFFEEKGVRCELFGVLRLIDGQFLKVIEKGFDDKEGEADQAQ